MTQPKCQLCGGNSSIKAVSVPLSLSGGVPSASGCSVSGAGKMSITDEPVDLNPLLLLTQRRNVLEWNSDDLENVQIHFLFGSKTRRLMSLLGVSVTNGVGARSLLA